MAYNKRLLFAPLGHKIDYLVVGGGGGGGSDMGGGGGAGGFQSSITSSTDLDRNQLFSTVYNTGTPTTASIAFGITYEIQVGAGGAGKSAASGGTVLTPGSNGDISFISASSTEYPFRVESFGGGGGGSDHSPAQLPSPTGASGGGNPGNRTTANNIFIDGQGQRGGASAGTWYPASGGGAGGPGRSNAADGGIGKRWDILGQEYWWCGGGAGAGYSARPGNGGKGGGGGGGPRGSGGGNGDASGLAWNNGSNAGNGSLNSQANQPGGAAGANTGGGGGGSSHYQNTNPGGNGGSGIVVLQMQKALYSGIHTGDPVIRSGSISGVSDLEHVALIFTQSGTYTAVNATGSIS